MSASNSVYRSGINGYVIAYNIYYVKLIGIKLYK